MFPCSHQPSPSSSFSPRCHPPTLAPSSLPCSAAARRPLDLDKPTRHKSTSPGRYDAHAPVSSRRDYSPDYSSVEPKRSRYPRQDPAAPHSRSRYPEHYLVGEGGRSKHADPYPEHLLPSRGKHWDRYPDYEPTETGRARGPWGEEPETVVRRKERPARPPPPQSPIERDKDWEKDRDRQRDRVQGRGIESERQMLKDQRKDREQDYRRRERRDGERSRDRVQSGDRYRETERQRQKENNRGRQRARARSMERGLEEDPRPSRDWPREGRASLEEEWDDGERERRARGRQHFNSGAEEVFEELRSNEGRGDSRQWEGPSRKRSDTHPDEETGTTLSPSLWALRGCLCGVLDLLSLLCQSQVVGWSNIAVTNENTNFLFSRAPRWFHGNFSWLMWF